MLRPSLLENPESPLRSNPWSPSSTFVDVGSLQRVISLAERTGHLERRSDETDEIARQASLTSTSVQMITILKDITKLGHALNKLNRELQNLIRDAETQDITDIDMLGQRAHKLEKMATHLSSIVEKKDDLIGRLQQPFIGEYLEMDSAYHYSVSTSLPRIASCLASLPEHLENLEWAKKFSLTDGQLENVLVGIEASFADLQNHFRAVMKSRKAMDNCRQAKQQQKDSSFMEIARQVIIHSEKDSDIELKMKELELEIEDLSPARTTMNNEGQTKRLRRTSSFIERNKRQFKFRRKSSSTGSLLITGTSSRVHTIKERVQERVLGKQSKKSIQTCDKVGSNRTVLSKSKSKELRKKGQKSQDEGSNEKESKLLPDIAKQADSNVQERAEKDFKLETKERHLKKKNFKKPTASFKTSLPPIAENYEILPNTVENRPIVNRAATPLPFLKDKKNKQ